VSLVTFNVPADAYARFMGRFSEPLGALFVDRAHLLPGQRALDVGCGPGALTTQLVRRLGAENVCAVDPSATFVDAVRARFPLVDVRMAAAEDLPFADDSFDCALAQLVVHFMADPVAGLTEMRRVTRPGGLVAASVWDQQTGGNPLATFWAAARDTDEQFAAQPERAGTREGHLAELCLSAGLRDVESGSLTVTVEFASFAEWWEPYTLGVGPIGDYLTTLDEDGKERLRARCAELLPAANFAVSGRAWWVGARA